MIESKYNAHDMSYDMSFYKDYTNDNQPHHEKTVFCVTGTTRAPNRLTNHYVLWRTDKNINKSLINWPTGLILELLNYIP